jgi:hypothetical protein
VYGLNFEPQASDAFLGYPNPMLGMNYCVIARPGLLPNFPSLTSQLAVVATTDNTTVTITPSVTANISGHPGTTPFSVLLNAGQTYQLRSDGPFDDTTGTIITSDKPVAVFGGARCARVPDQNTGACNQLVEEQLPVDSWGTYAVGFPLASRSNGDTYRVLAATDNTALTINGLSAGTLQKGQFFDTIINGPAEFLGSHPIQVAQFSNGSDFDGTTGDPFEILLPPAGKYLRAYTVSVSDRFTTGFLNLVVDQFGLNTTVVDGQFIPSGSFQPIGTGGFFGTQLAVAPGPHVISCFSPIGVQVYGFADFDGYGYVGGISR